MTSANVLQTQAGPGQILNANAKAVKMSGISGMERAASFSSFFQGTSCQTPVTADSGKQSSCIREGGGSSFSQKKIIPAQTKTTAEKLTDASDTTTAVKQRLLDTTAEKLDLDETELEDAMTALGMTAFDLLDPQKLAQLYMQVSGGDSQAEMLMSPQFVDLMQAVSEIGSDLMSQLGMAMDELDEVVAQLDLLEQPVQLESLAGDGIETAGMEGIQNTGAQQMAETGDEVFDASGKMQEDPYESVKLAADEASSATDKAGTAQTKAGDGDTSDEAGEGKESPLDMLLLRNGAKTAQGISSEQTGNIQNPVFTETLEAQLTSEISSAQSSLSSVNPFDLIEQIAENVRVSISQENSSMEMQLNPENLGKIYLQVSAREGSVHATIAAQNEAVRAALESQVAELKESLNQSGMKVDAVEVMVASHEFEKNLEQNEKRQQEEGERQQERISRRRNLNLTMPEELAGDLSEEETLAAQIMRDNGNSVDLTA